MVLSLPFCARCHPLGFKYIRCESSFYITPGDRDPECSCCGDPFEEERETRVRLFKHDDCQHVWHSSCMDAWIESCTATAVVAERPATVSCPMCRKTIVQYMPIYMRFLGPFGHRFSVATDVELTRILQLGRQGVCVEFKTGVRVLYDLIHRLDKRFCNEQAVFDYFRKNIVQIESNGTFTYRSIQVPANSKPGSEIFHGIPYIHGGMIQIQYCNHISRRVLVTPEQVLRLLPELYLQGGRVQILSKLPLALDTASQTLAQAIGNAASQRLKEVWIKHTQLAVMFPDFAPFQQGWELYLKVFREEGIETCRVQAFCTYAKSFRIWSSFVHHVSYPKALSIIDMLGGLGDDIKLEQLPDREVRTAISLRQYDKDLRYPSINDPWSCYVIDENGRLVDEGIPGIRARHIHYEKEVYNDAEGIDEEDRAGLTRISVISPL